MIGPPDGVQGALYSIRGVAAELETSNQTVEKWRQETRIAAEHPDEMQQWLADMRLAKKQITSDGLRKFFRSPKAYEPEELPAVAHRSRSGAPGRLAMQKPPVRQTAVYGEAGGVLNHALMSRLPLTAAMSHPADLAVIPAKVQVGGKSYFPGVHLARISHRWVIWPGSCGWCRGRRKLSGG